MTALLWCVLMWGDGPVLAENRLGLPKSVLAIGDIREQLDSGLTTTFILTVSSGDEEFPIAHMEVRYEPWDEVYYVRQGNTDGEVDKLRFPNFEGLSRWWSSPFAELPDLTKTQSRWTVTLAVIPFSYDERDQARRWLIGNPRADRVDQEDREGSSNVMASLLATSIRREPMRRFRWKIKPK